MTEFEEILSRTLAWEGFGKLTDTPGDRGGATKWGVTRAVAQRHGLDVETLTKQQATHVYWVDYYVPIPTNGENENLLPDIRIKWLLFDVSVNSGPSRAIKLLQRALAVQPTGVAESETIQAALVATRNPDWADVMIAQLSNLRAQFYRSLVEKDSTQEKFLASWLRRAADRGDGLKELIGSEEATN